MGESDGPPWSPVRSRAWAGTELVDGRVTGRLVGPGRRVRTTAAQAPQRCITMHFPCGGVGEIAEQVRALEADTRCYHETRPAIAAAERPSRAGAAAVG